MATPDRLYHQEGLIWSALRKPYPKETKSLQWHASTAAASSQQLKGGK